MTSAGCGFPGVLLPRWPLRACCYRSGSADAARSRATDAAATRAHPAAILGLRCCTARASQGTWITAFGASTAIASTVSRRGQRMARHTPRTIPTTVKASLYSGVFAALKKAVYRDTWRSKWRSRRRPAGPASGRQPGPWCPACPAPPPFAAARNSAARSVAPRPGSLSARNRSACPTEDGQPRSRTVATYPVPTLYPSDADLESVLGLAPQQIYSRLVVSYSSEVQQRMRTGTALGKHPHARQAAPSDRHQGCAGSLHPDGRASADP